MAPQERGWLIGNWRNDIIACTVADSRIVNFHAKPVIQKLEEISPSLPGDC
jgi:hypothetical protein